MKLRDLLAGVPLTGGNADLNMEINSLSYDSRTLEPGALFVTLSGSKTDGHRYVAQALEKGAAAILCREPPRTGSWLSTPDPRAALARVSAAWFGYPGEEMTLIGVTGTNGKTTTTYLIKAMLEGANLIGALELPAHRTTPEPYELQALLRRMADAGCTHVVMEVSSHALAQSRVEGLTFQAGVFTNLTQDHLDYHGDMERYFEAKRRLFLDTPERDKAVAINADDAYGRRLLNDMPGAAGYGLTERRADRPFLAGELLADTPDGLRLRLAWRNGSERVTWELTSPLVGRHNAANLMAVMTLALQSGFTPGDFVCFHDFYGVSGRLERIPAPSGDSGARGAGVGIFVDYAHTPDALVRAQEALRDAGFARVITVFGCGGDRDRTKRPLMGKAVADASDVAVVTSDNPRTEDPEAIIDDIMPGLADAAEVHRESDRRKALALALELARPGDALLVAGKGHEPYQIIGTVKHPFSDQGILKELLSCE